MLGFVSPSLKKIPFRLKTSGGQQPQTFSVCWQANGHYLERSTALRQLVLVQLRTLSPPHILMERIFLDQGLEALCRDKNPEKVRARTYGHSATGTCLRQNIEWPAKDTEHDESRKHKWINSATDCSAKPKPEGQQTCSCSWMLLTLFPTVMINYRHWHKILTHLSSW